MSTVLAFMDDLLFLSRIREAAQARGLEVRVFRTPEELLPAAQERPHVVLVDLDSTRLPIKEALAALRADPRLEEVPVVGFFSHVHAERGREARAAGCTKALPRSAFVQELAGILERPPHVR